MRIDCKSVKVGAERFDAPSGVEIRQDGDELVIDTVKPPRFRAGDTVDVLWKDPWTGIVQRSTRLLSGGIFVEHGGVREICRESELRHHFEPGDPVAFVDGGSTSAHFIKWVQDHGAKVRVVMPGGSSVEAMIHDVFPVCDRKPAPPEFKVGDVVRLSARLKTTDGFWIRLSRVEVVEGGRPTQIVSCGTHFCGDFLRPLTFTHATVKELHDEERGIDGMRSRMYDAGILVDSAKWCLSDEHYQDFLDGLHELSHKRGATL